MARKKEALTNLGKIIKKGMIDKSMTLTDLAAEVGTSPSFLGHIMYGRRPGKMYVPLIEKALDIDLSRFKEQDAAS